MEANNCPRIQKIYFILLFKKGVAGHTHFHVLRKLANEYCFRMTQIISFCEYINEIESFFQKSYLKGALKGSNDLFPNAISGVLAVE